MRKPNYQRISRKYPTSAFRLRNNRMGICRFDAELGIHKPVRYLDFTTVRRVVMYNARQYMYSVIQ